MPCCGLVPRLARVTSTQFRQRLKALGLSQMEASRRLGVAPRTVRRWALDEAPIPNPVVLLLKYWLRDVRQVRRRLRAKG